MSKSLGRLRGQSAAACAVAALLIGIGVAADSPAHADPTLPIGQDIYLADLASSTPEWYDSSTQTWKKLTLPGDSSAVVVSPDAKTVYFNSPTLDAVIAVEAASGDVTQTIPLGADAGYIGGPLLALDPSGTTLYVAGDNGVVSRIDTALGTVTGSVDIGQQLGGVAVSQDGATVYVAGWGDNKVVALDAATLSTTWSKAVDNDPQGLQLSLDGTELYVGHTALSNGTSAAVTVLDTSTGLKLWTITRDDYGAVQGPGNLSLSVDGTKLYGTDNQSGYAVIDTATHAVTRTALPLSGAPFTYVGITADAKTALFSMSGNGIAYFDTETDVMSAAEAHTTVIGGIAVAPDQAPGATIAVTAGTTGSESTLDASASTAAMCPIGTYAWDFGDGTTVTATTASVKHTYTQAGSYTVGLTLTTKCGTSTTTVFTGQERLRSGGPSAITSTAITVADPAPASPTPTPTSTVVPTPTPTTPRTASPTPTSPVPASPTATPTATPTASPAPRPASPTATATAAPTVTPTASPTSTASVSPTASATATSASATASPSSKSELAKTGSHGVPALLIGATLLLASGAVLVIRRHRNA